VEEPSKDIPAENSELLKELDAIRGRHRLLKIVAVIFSLVFLVAAVLAVLLYRKISAAKQAFETIQQVLPASGLVETGPENNSGAPSQGFLSPGGPAPSSLTVFINANSSISGGGKALVSVDRKKTFKAFLKYADRPIVKEFIVELKKNPSFRKALADSRGNNPLKVLAGMRNIKGMDKIVAKFAYRPDFMKLMTEVMSDPELKPMMQGLSQSGMTAMPHIPAGESSSPAEPDESGAVMRFDPSAINGGPQSAPTSAASDGVFQPASVKRKAPPPI